MAALGQAVSEAARQLAAERQGMDRVPGSGRNGPWQSEAGQHVTAAGLHGHSSRTNQAERPDTVPAADLAGPADQSGQPGLHTVQILPGRATGRHIQSLTDQAASSQEEPAGSVQPMTASPLYAALPASAIAAAEPAVPASDTNPGLANDPAGPLELSGQVIEAIRLRSGPFGETLTVRLKPDRFGEVHIRLARSDTAFSASIVTSQAETYDLLLSELGRLQEALQARGLAVSRIDLVRDTSQSTGTAADQASNDSQAFLAHSQTGQENWSSRDSRGMDRPVTGPGPEQTRSLPARADADRDRPRYGLIDRMA